MTQIACHHTPYIKGQKYVNHSVIVSIQDEHREDSEKCLVERRILLESLLQFLQFPLIVLNLRHRNIIRSEIFLSNPLVRQETVLNARNRL